MNSTEIRSGPGCEETEKIAKQLKVNFMDKAAREHLVECTSCRETLEKTENDKIPTLVRSIRNGVACSG